MLRVVKPEAVAEMRLSTLLTDQGVSVLLETMPHRPYRVKMNTIYTPFKLLQFQIKEVCIN